jgi:NADPH:quinone reductase-like Zn-dependent oxidoreductase
MGIIELPQLTFGYEAAGIVRRIGPEVTKVHVGDRVVLTGIKSFATVVVTSELLCEVLPESISYVDGASMPLVFLTAMCCLMDIGHLEKGQVRNKGRNIG